jgi:uncharacterized protein
MLALELAGEPLRLHGARALFWPRAGTLIVADVHLGKGAALRRAGIGWPRGGTRADLQRLAALIAHYGAQRLLVLGDLFHTQPVAGEPLFADFDAFRAAHRTLALVAVQGNHDRAAQRLPGDWRIDWVNPPLHEGPFAFVHEPCTVAGAYALGGHLHPALRLRSGSDRARVPVFCFGPELGVLPAFGESTGHMDLQPPPGARLYAAAGDAVVALPSTGGRRRAGQEIASCRS